MDENEIFENSTWVTFKFKTIRVMDNIFVSHRNTIKIEIGIEQDIEESEVSIVLEKIHFWFDHIVSNSVLFCRDNEFALSIMFDDKGSARTQNLPMVLPEEPTDDHLVKIFHAKLTAFGAGVMGFGSLEMTSDTKEELMTLFMGDGTDYLPDMVDWIGEKSYFEEPWWSRDDGTTLDVVPPEGSDLTDAPIIGIDMSFIEDRYRRNDQDTAIIIRPEFRPEVISGGKDEVKETNDTNTPKD